MSRVLPAGRPSFEIAADLEHIAPNTAKPLPGALQRLRTLDAMAQAKCLVITNISSRASRCTTQMVAMFLSIAPNSSQTI